MVRFKHRYLLVHLIFPASLPDSVKDQHSDTTTTRDDLQINLSESGIISLLRDSLSVNFGDVGAGEVAGTFSGQC